MSCRKKCCCRCAGTCVGDTPCRWTLAVDGAEFVAHKLTGATGTNAIWRGAFAAITYKGCEYDRVLLFDSAAAGNKLEVQLYHSTGTQLVTWRGAASVGRPFDCRAVASLAYLSSGGACTPSTTPGTMTATPSLFTVCSSSGNSNCPVCLGGTTPDQYRIDIVGMRDRFAILCNICATLDGSYVVSPVGSCWYAVEFPAVCGYNRIELLLAPGAYYVSISKSGAGVDSLRYALFGMAFPRDCRVSGVWIPSTGGPGTCDHFFSTCHITAL